jgi:hypothetical protein
MPSSCGDVAAHTVVAAPCSVVLNPSAGLPSSSTHPEGDHLFLGEVARQRRHDPAWVQREGPHAGSRAGVSRCTANSTFAVFA